MKKILSVAIFGLFAAASSANAAAVTFSSLAAFSTAAAVGGIPLSLEQFSGANSALPVSLGGLTVSDLSAVNAGQMTDGFFSGTKAIQDTTSAGLLDRFTFSSAINAFGVQVFDLGTVGPTTLAYTLSNGATGNLFVNFSGGAGNLLFAGVIDTTPFTWIDFQNSVNGDFVEFDNVQSGAAPAAVPEPASLTLLGLGLAGVASRRRRSRKNQ